MTNLLWFLAFSAFAIASDADGEKAVRESLGKFLEAAQKGDEATLKAVHGDSLVYAHSSATVHKHSGVHCLARERKHYELKPGWTVQM